MLEEHLVVVVGEDGIQAHASNSAQLLLILAGPGFLQALKDFLRGLQNGNPPFCLLQTRLHSSECLLNVGLLPPPLRKGTTE
jgi:hypothetical protein